MELNHRLVRTGDVFCRLTKRAWSQRDESNVCLEGTSFPFYH